MPLRWRSPRIVDLFRIVVKLIDSQAVKLPEPGKVLG